MAKVEGQGRIHGVSICKRAPNLSHLLFADDPLLFCQANQEEVQAISEVLQTYAVSSGQRINFEKSSIYFSSNMEGDQREIKIWRVKSSVYFRVPKGYSLEENPRMERPIAV